MSALKSLMILAFPILVGNLGQMLIGAGDVYVASLYSTEAVAAIGVANGFLNPLMLLGIGLMGGVSPALAIRMGRGEDMSTSLKSIVVFAFLSGIFLTLLSLALGGFLVDLIGVDEKIAPSVKSYIMIVSWSFPFVLAFQSIKEFLQAYEKVALANLLAFLAVFFNLVLDYALVFGIGAFEGMGVMGLAVASLAIRALLFFSLLLFVLKKPWGSVSFVFINNLFKFGAPVGFVFFLEVLAFSAVSILSGKLGVIAAAANNIILTITSITFMFPVAISSAVAVKVGMSYGARNYEKLRSYMIAATMSVLAFTGCSALFFLLLPSQIMRSVSQDASVITIGIQLLFIIALFQVVDGLQVCLAGILRGVERAATTSAMVLVGYWFFGVPLGIYLAFGADFGVVGLWIGLACALATLATSLGIYTYKIDFKKEMRHGL